ncbi:MAG: hypothetical protein VYC34_11825, partial [Planctomycetota bacterium]|nr:hypothetical protein [Planctomycetota bacterium]
MPTIRSIRSRTRIRRRTRANNRRRGTIIILAVGILAVLAVAALSYVTVARLDRSSATAYSVNVNFQQQVDAVVNEISALMAADLFGNKIVTNSTPRVGDAASREL